MTMSSEHPPLNREQRRAAALPRRPGMTLAQAVAPALQVADLLLRRAGQKLDALDATAAALIQRLHARVQELERQRGACWVPVAERLPEPGTPVLLDIGKRFPIRAMWAAKHTVEAPPEQVDIDWGDYDKTTDTYYSPEGWYEWNAHEECHWFVHDAPRAWMALPEQDRARGAQG